MGLQALHGEGGFHVFVWTGRRETAIRSVMIILPGSRRWSVMWWKTMVPGTSICWRVFMTMQFPRTECRSIGRCWRIMESPLRRNGLDTVSSGMFRQGRRWNDFSDQLCRCRRQLSVPMMLWHWLRVMCWRRPDIRCRRM